MDLDNFNETLDKVQKDPSKAKKIVEFEGEWFTGETGKGTPQFSAKIGTERGGEVLIRSDETLSLGGGALRQIRFSTAFMG